jgi:hypothetical protein
MSVLQQGLRISQSDYESLLYQITTLIEDSGILLNNPKFRLNKSENKAVISPILKSLIDNKGIEYGWDQISQEILEIYVFELFKRWFYNKKRNLQNTSPADPPVGSNVPVTPTRPSTRNSSLETPQASTPQTHTPQYQIASQRRRLHECTLRINRLDDGREHEDTIDVFLKPALANSPGEHSPNDYDFSIFKSELAEALSYDSQSDFITYCHSTRGFSNVDSDSRWRVALRDLADHSTSSGILDFRIENRGIPSGLRGLSSSNANTRPTDSSPSQPSVPSVTSGANQEPAHAPEPRPARPPLSPATQGATQGVAKTTDRDSHDSVVGRQRSRTPPTPQSLLSSRSATQPNSTIANEQPKDNQKWVVDQFSSNSSDSDGQEVIARTLVFLRDGPSTISSTGNNGKDATETSLSDRSHTVPQLHLKHYASSPESAHISEGNNNSHVNVQGYAQDDDEDSSSDVVPAKRRKVLKSFEQDSGSLKSRKNEDSADAEVPGDEDLADTELTDEDANLIPYDNSSDDGAEETSPVHELTEEEHERL